MDGSYAADIPSIKVEGGGTNGPGPQIKQDPDVMTTPPPAQSEEDIYEDAGDLDFTGSEQSVYLTRIPKFLWECWSKLDDEEEIQIGRIRVEGQPGEIKRMSLMLDASIPKNRSVPKEYNMHITNQDSFNTFIFSEKDMPGYRQFTSDRAPSHWLNRKRVEKKKIQSSFRRAIPKQTILTGQVRTEINCLPVENDEYQRITDQRALLALRPKEKTKLLNTIVPGGGSILNPGTTGSAGDFTNFINKANPVRRKGQMLKAARMPRNDLLDLIYQAFQEYTYWPFKVLKDRVQQPEVYLKSTLEMIAFQAKSGSHMMEWQLKPEAKIGTYAEAGAFDAAKDEAAPDDGLGVSFDGAEDMEQDDENIDMEDVPLEQRV
ncbi:MAG: hypothetical protein Q9217_001655 [Psora testacea]